MILITIEEIAVYVKKEIIRDLFADIKKYQCVIDIWLNGKLLPKNIARVSQYFLNETKDQLMDLLLFSPLSILYFIDRTDERKNYYISRRKLLDEK